MKNTADSGEIDKTTIDMGPQQDIGFQLPPPYSIEQPPFQNYGPDNAIDASGSNPLMSVFNQSLGNNEKFILAPIGRFGFTTRTLIVQLQDTGCRPLMSIMNVPGQHISTGHDSHHHHNISVRIGPVIQITSASGQTLLIARENGQSMTVTCGDHVLGIVEGSLFCSNTLTVRGVMGEILFESIGTETNAITSTGCFGSTPSEFTLISNGVVLARIERQKDSSNGVISLLNSQNVDLRTKALLIFIGYLMFYAFLADTSFGQIGGRGFAKRLCMYVCILFLVLTVLLFSIPIIVILTR